MARIQFHGRGFHACSQKSFQIGRYRLIELRVQGFVGQTGWQFATCLGPVSNLGPALAGAGTRTLVAGRLLSFVPTRRRDGHPNHSVRRTRRDIHASCPAHAPLYSASLPPPLLLDEPRCLQRDREKHTLYVCEGRTRTRPQCDAIGVRCDSCNVAVMFRQSVVLFIRRGKL